MKKLFSLVIVIIIAIVAYILVRPYFISDVVDEELPFSAESIIDLDKMKDAVKTMTAEQLEDLINLPEPEMIEKMTESAKQTIELSIVERMAKLPPVEVEDTMDDAMTEESKQAMEEDPSLGPVLIRSGNFSDQDFIHKGSGQAEIFELPDNTNLLRLENFAVTNGPDLFVYLVKHPNPSTSANVKADFVNLGKLKGNKGNQNYIIPADIDPSEYGSVVIWCRAFSVLFSGASLTDL